MLYLRILTADKFKLTVLVKASEVARAVNEFGVFVV